MKNRKHSLTALLAAILCVAAVLSTASASEPVQDDTKAVTKTSYGTGRYQYAIAGPGSDGKDYSIQYKDSFTVG